MTQEWPDQCFKAYDIRGEIPGQVNLPFAYRFGQAVAAQTPRRSVVVGHDMRIDSPALAGGIIQGLLDSGVDVLPLGQREEMESGYQIPHDGHPNARTHAIIADFVVRRILEH